MKFVINENNLGAFVSDEKKFQPLLEEMRKIVNGINDKYRDRELKKAAKLLKSMVTKEPLFLRGQAILGEMYLDMDDEAAAQETHIRGAKAALKLIPEDFRGAMDIEIPEVQCFLRCHSSYAASFAAKGDYKGALAMYTRHLLFDPADMFDQGRDMGELAILAGDENVAEAILTSRVENSPTALYSLAYMAFTNHNFPRAITCLRRAFVRAPYTAAFITGHLIAPNVFWEQGPADVDYRENMSYMELLGGKMWTDNQESREFLEWLSQTSLALRERAMMAGVSERCLAAEDGEEMEAAVKDWNALYEGIDDESSAKLARDVDDPEDGERMLPWQLYSRAQERILGEDDFDAADDKDDDEV